MAGLFDRFSAIAREQVSRLLDLAEDPGEALEYAYQRQLASLGFVNAGLVDVVAVKRRVQAREAALRTTADHLDAQARASMAAGDDDLARAALEREQLIRREVESLEAQVAELEAERRRLSAAEARLDAKVRAFRTRKEVLKAHYSVAEAEAEILGAANGVGEEVTDAGLMGRRAIEKAERMRARAQAVEDVEAAPDHAAAIPPTAEEIDRQITELGMSQAVDAEFTRLKAELGLSP